MIFIKIISIILIFNLIFLSSIGFGYIYNKIFLNKQNIGIYELFFYSIPLLLLISLITHFFTPINYFVSGTIIIIGSLISVFNFKEIIKDKFSNYLYLFSLLIFIPFILGGTPHADFYYHHLPYLNTIFNYKIIFGLINLNDVLANPYMTWFDYSILFNLPPYKFQINQIVNAVLFFSFINFLIKDFTIEKNPHLKCLNIFLIIIPLALFSKLNDHGADLPAQLFIILTIKEFISFFIKKTDEQKIENFHKILLFSCISIILRINSVFILPLVFIIFFISIKISINKVFNIKKIIFLFLLTSLFIAKNFISSGCLIYPIHQTCFNSKNIEWSIEKELTEKRSNFLEASSKGWMFYIKENSTIKEKFIWNPVENLKNHKEYLNSGIFFWTKYWFLDHDKFRIINVFLISILIFLFIFFSNYKNIKYNLFKDQFKIKIFFFSLLPVIFWFIKTPQSRFAGYAIFIGLFASFFIFIISKSLNYKKINTNYSLVTLLIVAIFFFVNENINLLKINLLNNKNYSINQWIEYPDLALNKDYISTIKNGFNINLRLKTKKLYAGNIKDQFNHILYCGDIKQFCMPVKKIECLKNIKKKYSFIFAIADHKTCLKLINKHVLY